MSDVFNDIQSVRNFLNRNVQLPKTLPNGCNAVCYYGVGYCLSYCKEVNNHVYHYAENDDRWLTTGFENLEKMARCNNKFAYLRLSEKRDKFTPERLIGVETDKGFITNVVEIGFYDIMKPSYYVYTTESLSKEDLYDVHSIKYYISDDSDETVSFDEYVKLFYDVEGVL